MKAASLFSNRLVVITGGCLALALVAGAWVLTRPRPSEPHTPVAQPRLGVDTAFRDLGIVLPGGKLDVTYRLENLGEEDLIVSNLHSSCGCAPAVIDTNTIPPGGSAAVTVSYRAPMTAGVAGHAVLFRTNDPEHPDVYLPFQVLVRRPIEPLPPNLYAGVVPSGQSVTHDLELDSTEGVPFEVKAISASAPWIRVERLPVQAVRRLGFRVTITGGPNRGAFAESIRFVTSCPKQDEVVVPVLGETVSASRITPASLLLNGAASGATVDTKLLVTSVAGDVSPIHSVATKDGDWQVLSWKLERKSPAVSELHMQIRVPSAAGYQRTTLVLRDATGVPTQEILLTCLVSDKRPARD
jgi:hypothetical protein